MIKEIVDPFDFDPEEQRQAFRSAVQRRYHERRTGKKVGTWGGKREKAGNKGGSVRVEIDPEDVGTYTVKVNATRLQVSMLNDMGGIQNAINKWIASLI